jgi:hypothetical protein
MGQYIINCLLITEGGFKVMRKIFVLTIFAYIAILLGFGAQSAMADDAVLFPYFSSGGGDLTFIQIINDRTVVNPLLPGKLNYVYVYNTDTEICQHYNDTGNTTNKDILLYELTNSTPGASGQLLPGDTTSTSPMLTVYPSWGYLVVAQSDNFATGGERTLYGQATIVNINTGSAVIYNAINDPNEVDGFYFTSSADWKNVISWIPEDYASTVWYFFTTRDSVDLTDPDRSNGIVWDSTVGIGHNEGGAYNNNESLKSGTKYIMVGCWDTEMETDGHPVDPPTGPETANFFYTLAEILTGAQYNAVKSTGGWTATYWMPETDYGYVYKFVTSSILGKTMSAMVYESQFSSSAKIINLPVTAEEPDGIIGGEPSYTK